MESYEKIGNISMKEWANDQEQSLAFFEYVISHISEIAVLIDRSGHIIYANNRAHQIIGFSLAEICSGKIWDLAPILNSKNWDRAWSWLTSRDFLVFETDLRSRWGVIIPVRIRASNVIYKDAEYVWALISKQGDYNSIQGGTRIRRAELLKILDKTPDVIVRYDRDLRKTYVNKSWERANGAPASYALGKAPHETDTKITSEYRQFEDWLKKIFRTGEVSEYDITWESKNGPVCYNLQAIPELNQLGEVSSILTFARDISAQKREIQLHHEREQMFQALLENSPDAIIRYDLECNRIYVNRTFARLAGVPAEELVGKKPSDFNNMPDSIAYEETILKTVSTGKEQEIEYKWTAAGGTRIVSHVRMVPEFDSNQRLTSVLATGRDITRLRRVEAKMNHLAHYDSLTSLPNRILIRKLAIDMLRKAHLEGKHVAIFFLDLDNFKRINDSLGHIAGDEMLLHIASRLRNELLPNELIGRIGGDEFLLITSDRADEEKAKQLAWQIICLFEQPVVIENLTLSASASIGISISPQNGTDFDTLLRKADAAMYMAKKDGRNTFSFFNEKNETEDKSRLLIYSAMKQALKNNEFVLHFQPQISLADGSVCGAEALIRWNHPEKGLLQPRSFIPIAESHGLIDSIGDWVLRTACQQATVWRERTGQEIPVAVNVSPLQFRKGNIDRVISEILSETKLPPHMLEIELTESAMLHNLSDSINSMQAIQEMGVKISIDDFGTGYSSLSQVTKLPLNRLKIDGSFVMQLEKQSKESVAIIRTIIQVAKTLDLQTVAEGVETDSALEILKQLDCDTAQGFLFSRALSLNAFLRFIAGDRDYSMSRGSDQIPGPPRPEIQ